MIKAQPPGTTSSPLSNRTDKYRALSIIPLFQPNLHLHLLLPIIHLAWPQWHLMSHRVVLFTPNHVQFRSLALLRSLALFVTRRTPKRMALYIPLGDFYYYCDSHRWP